VRLRIATRKSPLALWQSEHVATRLRALEPGCEIELVPIVTEGDRILDRALAEVGGKGLFLKELQEALLDGRADLAVHSLKDMPAEEPEGLRIAALLEREDPRDAVVSTSGRGLAGLPAGARVGTSSPRRKAQLLALRPDLEVVLMRGNVGTRLSKLERGDCDALLLACAGLKRLGLGHRVAEVLPVEAMVPAPGQGIVAVECRDGDTRLLKRLAPLDDPESRLAARAERAFAAALGGSCHLALGAHAVREGGRLRLTGFFAPGDGLSPIRATHAASEEDPEALGRSLALHLLTASDSAQGASARGGEC
jgi:hydroxymethylbilane synthase